MFYVMKPLDNFFFRTSVPFEAGGETVAVESMFPPLPSVYAGAFCRYLGLGTDQIKIGFNGLGLEEQPIYPAPADLFWLREALHSGEGVLGPKILSESPVSNFPLDYCLHRAGAAAKDKERREPYLSEEAMGDYLNAGRKEYPCVDIGNGYLVREPKIGIAVDEKSGTSKEHLLYQTVAVRPAIGKSVGLMADMKVRPPRQGKNCANSAKEGDGKPPAISTPKIPENNVIHLGGEGRLASAKTVADRPVPQPENTNTRYFKLYLATPSIFEKGWIPGWMNEDSWEGTFTYKKKSVRVRLLTACVGRSIPCGGFGWDKKSKRYQPKELRYAVPAGSVFYFELLKGTFADVLKLFSGKCISDYRESFGFNHPLYDKYRYCDRGFGYALVGRLDKEQEEILNGR